VNDVNTRRLIVGLPTVIHGYDISLMYVAGNCVLQFDTGVYTFISIKCKGGDTLSSRHMSSCDITRAVGILEAI
jgi:hypothetical protein